MDAKNLAKIGGITIERISNAKHDTTKPKTIQASDSEDEDEDFETDGEPPCLPPGLTLEKKKPNLLVRPNIQLPPGIQLERRKKPEPIPQSSNFLQNKMLRDLSAPFQPESLIQNLMNNVVDIESDEEVEKPQVLPNIQLPPGISLEKKQSENHEDSDTDESDIEESIESMISDPEEPKSEDKDVVNDLVEMMTKGEIEGEIEEDEDKKNLKRKAEDDDDDEDEDDEDEESGGKKKKLDDEDDEDSDTLDKSKVSSAHLRKNIREVMDETKLDETTIAAQRQEAERLKRLQEQQRMLRERQSQSVLSLIRQNAETSILKKSMSAASAAIKEEPNQILLKMGNGQETNLSEKMRELLKAPVYEDEASKNLLKQVSSSVTISPIKKESPADFNNDVVTLSSDSDDDCVVISESEAVPETDEDPANSGMHTSDKYNVPDEQGRVLVNTGHPPDEPDVFLAPQVC